jgi:hypothetical protein
MFIWDFVLGTVLDQIIEWLYGQAVGFLADFFAQMGNMGVELFTMEWVQSVVLFFSYLAWALYGVGLVVSVFETGIEYRTAEAASRIRLSMPSKALWLCPFLQRCPLNSLNLPSASRAVLQRESPATEPASESLLETSWQSWAAHRILAVPWAPVFLAGYPSSQALS